MNLRQAILLRRNGLVDDSWKAVRELQSLGGLAIFNETSALCREGDAVERSVAADVLGQLGWKDKKPFAEKSTPILAALLRDGDENVVESAIYSLAHLQAEAVLAEHAGLASSELVRIRRAMAYALGSVHSPTAVSALLSLMKDEDVETRDWATFGVGTQCEDDTTEIRDALAARISDPDDETRCEAILGLARRRVKIVLPALIAELKRPEPYELAIEAAIEFGSADLIPFLESIAAEWGDDGGTIQEGIDRIRAASAPRAE